MLSFGKNPYGQQEYEEVLEKLKSGYRLPYPRETEHVTSWIPENVYAIISEKCFVENPDERADFDEVIKLIEDHLFESEMSHYTQMIETYESDYASNYLEIGNKYS